MLTTVSVAAMHWNADETVRGDASEGSGPGRLALALRRQLAPLLPPGGSLTTQVAAGLTRTFHRHGSGPPPRGRGVNTHDRCPHQRPGRR
jgi:hypothetical protein